MKDKRAREDVADVRSKVEILEDRRARKKSLRLLASTSKQRSRCIFFKPCEARPPGSTSTARQRPRPGRRHRRAACPAAPTASRRRSVCGRFRARRVRELRTSVCVHRDVWLRQASKGPADPAPVRPAARGESYKREAFGPRGGCGVAAAPGHLHADRRRLSGSRLRAPRSEPQR